MNRCVKEVTESIEPWPEKEETAGRGARGRSLKFLQGFRERTRR